MPRSVTGKLEVRAWGERIESDCPVTLSHTCGIDAEEESLRLKLSSVKENLKDVETKLEGVQAEERRMEQKLDKAVPRKVKVACPTGTLRAVDS